MAPELLLSNPAEQTTARSATAELDGLTKSKMKNIDCREISKVGNSGLLTAGRDYYRAGCATSESAERHSLLSGWRFDSDVQLLREGDGNTLRWLTNFLSRGIE